MSETKKKSCALDWLKSVLDDMALSGIEDTNRKKIYNLLVALKKSLFYETFLEKGMFAISDRILLKRLGRFRKKLVAISNCDEMELSDGRTACPWTPEGCAVFRAIEKEFDRLFGLKEKEKGVGKS